MNKQRAELIELTNKWISLWCVPTNWELFDILHADDFEDCSSAGRSKTKEGFRGGIENLINAFPDIQTRVEDIIIDETTGRIAVRWSAIGTNRREYLGKGPTNKQTYITGIEIIEIVNSRITKRWGEWDITSHYQN